MWQPQTIMRWSVWLLSAIISWSSLHAVPPSPTQPLDNPLEPLTPKQTRTEEEEDRLTAIALFSTGRMLEQRGLPSQAIRRYQRALRYDADAVPALAELVPLAFQANRPDEALRYLVKFGDRLNLSPDLLEQSGRYLLAADDSAGAITLYRRALDQLQKQSPSDRTVEVLAALGQLYFLSDQAAEAAPLFRQLLDVFEKPASYQSTDANLKELSGPSGQLLEQMGLALLKAGKIDDAEEAFGKLNALYPNKAIAALNAARIDEARARPEKALAHLDEYFKLAQEKKEDREPSESDKGIAPYQLLELLLAKLNRQGELVSRLETMYADQPKNAALAFFLGEQFAQSKQWDMAEKYLEASLKVKPTVKTYQSLAQVYRQTSQPESLLKLLADVVEKTGALVLLGDELAVLAADENAVGAVLDVAEKNHREARRKDCYPLATAALLAVEAKRWDAAEKLFDLALSTRPKRADEMVLHWALRLLLDDKPAMAEKVLRRGIAEKAWSKSQPAFYFYLATALEMQKKFDEAYEAARMAAEKQPDNPLFASRPASSLYHGKRNEEAEKAYLEFVSKYDDDFKTPGAREVLREAKQVLSHLALLRGDLTEAVEWLEQVLDEFPDDAGANNDLGYLWADENQHLVRAHRMIQFAVAAEPDNAAYRDSLGWVLYRLQCYGEALVELQKAAAESSPDGTVLEHLGDAYDKLGRQGEAKKAWERALEAFKKEAEEEKIDRIKKKLAM